ncbi:MAG: ribosomal protein S18-alanine N-acetyltransferase [Gammaproteobacteria bacterium]|nr:ribosomal protein S18-alanine N-acetyltransferase [Gammaproteobacteria bacterium]
MPVHYRPLCAADIDQLLELPFDEHESTWSRSALENSLTMGYVSQVASTDNQQGQPTKVVGYAVASYTQDQGDVQNIIITPAYRGQGVGRGLLKCLVIEMRKCGVEEVFLEVRCSNTVAIQLYETMGFVCIQKRRGYYPGVDGVREDALVFSLTRR